LNDLLVGILLGALLLGGFNPFKGIYWILKEQRKQIDFLTAHGYEASEEHGPGTPRPEEKKA
jgi:hypothetical protein